MGAPGLAIRTDVASATPPGDLVPSLRQEQYVVPIHPAPLD